MNTSSSRGTEPVGSPREWARAGMLAVAIGALLVVVGFTTRTTATYVSVGVVPLHNTDAETGSSRECPDEPSWHFVLAPNNGAYRFMGVTLDVGGKIVRYEAGQLAKNSGQLDNVFARVPAGSDVDDLRLGSSFAEVSPAGSVKFVLSHLCPGPKPPSTTTTEPHESTTTTEPHESTTTTEPHESTTTTEPHESTTTTEPHESTTTTEPHESTTTTEPHESTTTTVADTTTTTVADTTTTTVADTTTTVADTTTTVADTTTTTVASSPPTTSSTTTSTVVSQGPVPTTTVATSTTSTTVPGTIVITGAGGSRTFIMLGALLILIGTSLVLGARARSGDDPPVLA